MSSIIELALNDIQIALGGPGIMEESKVPEAAELLKDGGGNWAFPTLAGDESAHAQLVQVDSDQDSEPVFPE